MRPDPLARFLVKVFYSDCWGEGGVVVWVFSPLSFRMGTLTLRMDSASIQVMSPTSLSSTYTTR